MCTILYETGCGFNDGTNSHKRVRQDASPLSKPRMCHVAQLPFSAATHWNRGCGSPNRTLGLLCTKTNKPRRFRQGLKARATGLEPATTGSTVRYSNQLSYAPGAYPAARPLRGRTGGRNLDASRDKSSPFQPLQPRCRTVGCKILRVVPDATLVTPATLALLIAAELEVALAARCGILKAERAAVLADA